MSFENPVFSIITPTFRRPEMLVRNIKSVLSQTFLNYEHIIVDDGNDPATEKIIESFNDERLILVKHDQPCGAAAAYNTGIRKSRGEFISFLDDDDEYLPAFLEKMNENFGLASKETGFFWTGIERIKDSESGEELLCDFIWPREFKTREEALTAASSIGNGFGLCIRKECIAGIGLYDEDLEVCCDTDFLIRLAEKYECKTIPEILVRVHRHHNQLTDSAKNTQRIITREILFNRYSDIFEKNPEMYIIHLMSFILLCYSSALQAKGRSAVVRLIKKKPFRVRTYADLISLELTNKGISETLLGKFYKKVADWNLNY